MEQMVARLLQAGAITDKAAAVRAILDREAIASTALGNFSCFPHAKIGAIEGGVVAVGISENEIAAGSMDGRPTRIFILILSSNKDGSPHIQLMTQLAQKVDSLAKAQSILEMSSEDEIYDYFVK